MDILVGYDGSKVANNALNVAKQYAKAFNAKVHVVTSMEGGPEVPQKKFEQAEDGLKYAKNIIRRDDIACEAHLSVRALEPGEDLVRYAEERQIDQIIVGIRKRSKVGKLVFGSTAQYVILEAPCPVLTVK